MAVPVQIDGHPVCAELLWSATPSDAKPPGLASRAAGGTSLGQSLGQAGLRELSRIRNNLGAVGNNSVPKQPLIARKWIGAQAIL